MPARPFTKLNLAMLALLAASGCVASLGGTPASREPGFRATSVRRPALLIRVSVPPELSKRESDRIVEDYQAAVLENLERMGVLVVDSSFHLLQTICSRLYVMRQGVITGEHGLDEFPTADALVATYLQEGV